MKIPPQFLSSQGKKKKKSKKQESNDFLYAAARPDLVCKHLLGEACESLYLYLPESARADYLVRQYGDRIKAAFDKARELGHQIPDQEPEQVISMLASMDPSTEDDQPGQYTEWLVKRFVSDDPEQATPDEIKATLDKFHRNKQHLDASARDINKYKTFSELKDKMESVEDVASERAAKKDYSAVYKDDNIIVFSPQSHAASKYLASRPLDVDRKKATWCTAADSQDGSDYFDKYSEDGDLHIIFTKSGRRSQLFSIGGEVEEWRDNENVELSIDDDVDVTEDEAQSLIKFGSQHGIDVLRYLRRA